MPLWVKVVLGLAAAAALALVVERLIVTDEEAIRYSLDRVRACALKADVEGCLDEFAPDYSHRSLTREDLKKYGRTFVETSRLLKLEFIGRKLEVSGDAARVSVELLVRLREGAEEAPFLARFDVLYGRTAEGWKITGFEPR